MYLFASFGDNSMVTAEFETKSFTAMYMVSTVSENLDFYIWCTFLKNEVT